MISNITLEAILNYYVFGRGTEGKEGNIVQQYKDLKERVKEVNWGFCLPIKNIKAHELLLYYFW